MIINERNNRQARVMEIANQMMNAGRTAPKAKGSDILEIIAVTGDDILKLAEATREMSDETGMMFLLRDADNLMQSDAVILIGTTIKVMGLNCGYCGFSTCSKKELHKGVPCVMNSVDVGIAIGSMTAMAADMRADCRVMFSIGLGAKKMGLLEGCNSIFAIPVSVSSKSPFFDRVINH